MLEPCRLFGSEGPFIVTSLTREQVRQKSASEGIFFVDRESGEIREEVVFGRSYMEFFYGNGLGLLITKALLIRRFFSVLYGWYNDSGWSRSKIPGFIKKLELPLDEVQGEVSDFKTFNEFFARSLKPDFRPFDDNPRALISPADARIAVFDKIDGDTLLPIKGANIPVSSLLADPKQAERYKNGGAVVLRLCPADYHRFHFPAAGVPGEARSIPGVYHSVSPFALEQGLDVFCRNHRVVTELESELFGGLSLVDVGALCVGAIVQTYKPGEAVERGAEKGFFKFGGSSIVMLSEPGRVQYDEDLLTNTREGLETLVKFGVRLGVAPESE